YSAGRNQPNAMRGSSETNSCTQVKRRRIPKKSLRSTRRARTTSDGRPCAMSCAVNNRRQAPIHTRDWLSGPASIAHVKTAVFWRADCRRGVHEFTKDYRRTAVACNRTAGSRAAFSWLGLNDQLERVKCLRITLFGIAFHTADAHQPFERRRAEPRARGL